MTQENGQVSTDIATANIAKADVEKAPVPMDEFVTLLAEERECYAAIKWWEQRQALIKRRLAQILGDRTVGTVNGEAVITYEYQDRLNTSALKKDNPNMYQMYSREITSTQLDVDWLKRARPDLAKEYQVRTMRVTYKAPGAPGTPGMTPRPS